MDIPRCDAALHEALKEPRPKKLVDAINAFLKQTKKNADDPTSLEFICLDCKSEGVEGKARAFFASPPAIVLCANRLNTTEDVKEVVVHELIHAYDVRDIPRSWSCLTSCILQYTVRNMDLTQPAVLACRCSLFQLSCTHDLLVLISACPLFHVVKCGRRVNRNATRRLRRFARTRS
ncbi:hypothetical protein, variant 3 [Aphanomyces invadans]|uniref:Mitochondrial inner membrane protease ATP23 n=1 Tax=Aphanomyces invadans TaxID=157072 RepID=A0A024U7I3_9STRA|nr:hypothetical protein, variant 3 [Aphanomyces invadans]ETW02371.1 hypothetical protein, variant 3 [Aphanomyces invadans]|eukprot:XP_008868976.1 hypothetical protein, variant 3 [Aphanomyces invadans]